MRAIPVALAARYNAEGADELVVLDIAASRDRRPTFLETIRRVAAELAIPLTAGGGIRSLEDARRVVRAGADKMTVNTAAVATAGTDLRTFREFGAQAVVLAIDAKRDRRPLGSHVCAEAATPTGSRRAGVGTARGRTRRGRNSADFRGSRRHADRLRYCAYRCDFARCHRVPVIASGGAKLPEHFAEMFSEGAADAALAASIFHDNVQSIRELKQFLAARNIEVRLPC